MEPEIPATKQIRSRKQATMAVVAQQLISSNSSSPGFRLFGTPAQVIYLMGFICRVSRDSPHQISFQIEDNTGIVDAYIITETQDALEAHMKQIKPNRYSRIFASFKGTKNPILVLKIFPVDDANAVTHHLLLVTHTRLFAEAEFKKQLSDATLEGAALAHALLPAENVDEVNPELIQNDFHQKVLKVVQDEERFLNGLTRNGVLMHFPEYLANQVLEALEFLINVGMIYYLQDGSLKPVYG